MLMRTLILAGALLAASTAAGRAQFTQTWSPPAPCAITANYSATLGTASVVLFPAPLPGVPRTSFFVEITSMIGNVVPVVALNFSGGPASTSAPGSLVMAGQYEYINSAGLGFIPVGQVTAAAAAAGTVVTAYACPQ